MPKILSAEQIKAWDAYTIQHEPISSIDLMERACRSFVEWFVARFDSAHSIGIVCGTGNNGGDGLGIARMLHEWNYQVKVWIVKGSVPESEDFKKNKLRLPARIELFEITSSAHQGLFVGCSVLVDAIFGSGLSRPTEGIYAQAIRCFNQAKAKKVAIDIPSGLMCDAPSSGEIVKVDFTVSFQAPKLGFFMPENGGFVGDWQVVDIGLSKSFIRETETPFHYLNFKSVRKRIRTRGKFSHKGDYGKALLIAGSYGKMGACILAARAALRSGLGLLTAHVPKHGYSIIQTAVPEAMASIDANEEFISVVPELDSYDVIGIGPGIGNADATVKAMQKVMESGKPMVIDADALNILGQHRELLHLVPKGSILTPHPKEFERLAGPSKTSFERLERQRHLARELGSIVLVKGAHTAVAVSNGDVYFNTTGNPGMATGGSGDVLTGILTGLLAQGHSSEDAVLLGVFLHGLAGDLAVREKGMSSLIASDLNDFLASAFLKLTY
jgi:ADP-dependent NAD(P)H-hydrate dehydratase / NAD(P)H-hydrate epimerase